MPHSGGGGSHGGGSHGGSHGGGSSHRTSHTYFPGARRYRRHYNDGRPAFMCLSCSDIEAEEHNIAVLHHALSITSML